MAWTQALVLTAWLLLAGGLPVVSAEMRCGPEDAAGVRRCSAGLPAPLIQRMQVAQEKSQWCWAASLGMVFARYGHFVPQTEIVERLYGVNRDLPIRTKDIPLLVGRDWFDLDGGGFSAKAVAHPVSRPTLAGFRHLLRMLVDEHPLLLVTGRHVVVLVALEFEQYANGGGLRITGGQVLDPAPGQGLRALAEEETRPALLAHVRIRPRPTHFTSIAELNERDLPEASLARGVADAREDTLNGFAGAARD